MLTRALKIAALLLILAGVGFGVMVWLSSDDSPPEFRYENFD